jgi:hypothetical protein
MTTRTFPLSGPINLHVRIGRGSLTVTAQDDLPEASVTITARAADNDLPDHVSVGMDGRTLYVLARRQDGMLDMLSARRGDDEAVDVAISVPSGTAMKIRTYTADVVVHGRSGGADVAAGAAAIAMDEVDGDLRLRYGSASSTVGRVHGSVVVRSGSGDARFDEIDGDLQAGFGSGDLRIGAVRGSVRYRTGSGGTVLGSVHADVDVTAGSGDVAIGLPAGLAARLDIKTGSGRLTSELPVDDDRTGDGPTIAVRARTGSGDVRLFRAA